jgi:hypothetical protein
MGEFHPICEVCFKPIMWGQPMRQIDRDRGQSWSHDNACDCFDLKKKWYRPGDDKCQTAQSS